MRRQLLIIAAMIVIGIMVFIIGQRLAIHWCATQVMLSTDNLEWFRLEFRLSEGELARIRQLHEGYLPKCRDFCARIAARKMELQALLDSNTNAVSALEQKLIEIGTLRARCQTAMIQHFREVSQAMPPEQGRRYLAEMQRLTFGFHEEIEHSMSSKQSEMYGHR